MMVDGCWSGRKTNGVGKEAGWKISNRRWEMVSISYLVELCFFDLYLLLLSSLLSQSVDLNIFEED